MCACIHQHAQPIMNYIRQLFSSGLGDLVERRKAQLERQAVLDARLKKLPCYHVTGLYLLIVREDNRARTIKYADKSLAEHMDSVDRELDRLEQCLDAGTFCSKESPLVNLGFFEK